MKDRKAAVFGLFLLACGAACGVAFYFASGRLSEHEAKYKNDHPALRGDWNAPTPSPAEDTQYLLTRLDLVGARQRWMIAAGVFSVAGAAILVWGFIGARAGNTKPE